LALLAKTALPHHALPTLHPTPASSPCHALLFARLLLFLIARRGIHAGSGGIAQSAVPFAFDLISEDFFGSIGTPLLESCLIELGHNLSVASGEDSRTSCLFGNVGAVWRVLVYILLVAALLGTLQDASKDSLESDLVPFSFSFSVPYLLYSECRCAWVHERKTAGEEGPGATCDEEGGTEPVIGTVSACPSLTGDDSSVSSFGEKLIASRPLACSQVFPLGLLPQPVRIPSDP
jgi:hypothetical protein